MATSDEIERLRETADSGDSGAMFDLANSLREQGDLDEAESWHRRAAGSGNPYAMYALGTLLYYERADFDGAEDAWKQTIATGDITCVPPAIYFLAYLYAKQERIEEAKARYREVLSISEDDDLARQAVQNLTTLLRASGDGEEAGSLHREFVDRVPLDRPQIFNDYGDFLVSKSRWEEAEEVYRKAIASDDPRQAADGLKNLGDLFLCTGRFDDAAEYFRQAIDSGNLDDETAAAVGEAMAIAHDGPSTDSEETLRTAIASSASPDSSLLVNLGTVLIGQGRLDEAETVYRDAIDIGDSKFVGHAWMGLSSVYLMADRIHEAENAYRQALEYLDPTERAHGLIGLGGLLAKDGRQREAEAAYREALELEGDPLNTGMAWLGIGGIYAEEGRSEEARAALSRAVELGSPDIQAIAANALNDVEQGSAS